MKATREQACEAALSAALTYGTTVLDTLLDEHLQPSDFWSLGYQAIYRAMLDLHDADEPVDPITVKAQLEQQIAGTTLHGNSPWNDELHARATVDALLGPVPEIANLRSYIAIIRREARWSSRGEALNQAGEALHRRDEAAFSAAITRIDQATSQVTEHTHSPEQLGAEFSDWIEGNTAPTIATGLGELDEILAGGLRRGDTTIVAAWTSQGKSVLVDQILHHAAGTGATGAGYLNEMDRMDRTARTIARMTTVPYGRIIKRELAQDDHREILRAQQQLPFTIVECAGWSAQEIARDIRRRRWDIAAVDLVTRIPARETADWDVISGTLTDVARQTGTHVLLVCQLNQERNKTAIKPPPVMRDLRGTGSWGNDAANVLFLHREQVPIEGTGLVTTVEDGHVRVEKCRHGRPGELVRVTFNAARMRFDQLRDYEMGAAA